MAVRISLRVEEELSFPEEDVIVKQKPKSLVTKPVQIDYNATSVSADSPMESQRYPSNGGVATLDIETGPSSLEAAVDMPHTHPDSSRSSRSPVLWYAGSDLSLAGVFSVAGRSYNVKVEDDLLTWTPVRKSKKGL